MIQHARGERVRHHRVIGPLPQHREERHWAIAGAIVALIGIGISTYAASEQAAGQRRQAKATEKFRLAEAASARESAAFEERQFRRRVALLRGANTASLVGAGLDPTGGSPLYLELDTVRQAELNALNIRRTGELNATTSEFEARLARMKAGMVPSTGLIAGAGVASAAGSTTTVLGNWYRYNRGIGDPMPTQG
jgi:hypothetical protein